MLPETEQPRKPVRDVAWLSAAAFATICAGWLLFATMFRDTGWDFSQFYLAGSLPSALLYDRAAFEAAGQVFQEAFFAILFEDKFPRDRFVGRREEVEYRRVDRQEGVGRRGGSPTTISARHE